MGKASRRKGEHKRTPSDPSQQQPAFVRRPFERLPGETGWVAMREIVPAATARVTFTHEDESREATIASVLPLAWPGLHRADGSLFVALQTGGSSSDASRDIAEALLAVAALEPGQPLTTSPRATAASPRLQDLLTGDDFEVILHEGFDFWVEGQNMDDEGAESLARANEAITPTVQMRSATNAYWCRIGNRTYIRWVLPHDEDKATDALARLQSAGSSALGDGKLLGAFRAHGLLVPVWEVDAGADAGSFEDDFAALVGRLDAQLEVDTPLTSDELRARSGIASRQLTLR